jgi:DnaJ-domain-containing protein 1
MGLRGVLIGSMIGVVFGPAGAYVGGLAGGLLEDYYKPDSNDPRLKCPHCEAIINPQKGFFYCHACKNLIYYQIDDLTNYTQEEYIRLFVFCIFTLIQNLHVPESKLKPIHSFASEQLELTDVEVKFAFDAYHKAKNLTLSNEFLLQILSGFLNSNEYLTVALIHLFFQLLVDEKTIHTIAQNFDVDESVYQAIRDEYDYTKYYAILNCSTSDSPETIKRKYRDLLKEYHSDTLRSKGVSQLFIDFADQKTIELNHAYEKIKNLN